MNGRDAKHEIEAAAGALGGSDVEVTLLAPPPLERPLSLEHDGEEARLLDGQTVIAVARPTDEPTDRRAPSSALLGDGADWSWELHPSRLW